MDLDLKCERVEIETSIRSSFNTKHVLGVVLEGAETDEVLDAIGLEEILDYIEIDAFIEHKGLEEVLDRVDTDDVMRYLNLREKEDWEE